jgi:hypothetical protein
MYDAVATVLPRSIIYNAEANPTSEKQVWEDVANRGVDANLWEWREHITI